MGRLGNNRRVSHSSHPHPSGNEPRIEHFSHHHPLELTSLEQSLAPPMCAGCDSRPSGAAYYCKPCNYVLDVACAKMPRRVRHPAHPHSLNLLAMPPSSREGSSDCDACGRGSAGFTFHCDPCGFQLHCQCASLPLSVNHRGHAHPLQLVFSPPYENKEFECDLCGGLGSNHWLYRCAVCEFDAHIGCATATTTPRPPPPPQQPPPQWPPASRQQTPPARQPMPWQQTPPPALLWQTAPRQPPPWRQLLPSEPTQLLGLLRPLRPLLPSGPTQLLGLLRPLRPLQMNQAAQGPADYNSVEQQNSEGMMLNTIDGVGVDGSFGDYWSQDGSNDGSNLVADYSFTGSGESYEAGSFDF